MSKRWKLTGLLVLMMVLAACESAPPKTPSAATSSLSDRAQATAILQTGAVQIEAMKKASEDASRESAGRVALATSQAVLVDQQRKNEQLLAETKAAGEKALNDATVDGKRRADITEANVKSITAWSSAVETRIKTNIATLQDNLTRQADEDRHHSFLTIVAAVYPWLLAGLVALISQFVISVGELWWTRIHRGEPRWREPGLVERLLSAVFKTPYVRALELVPGVVLTWITEFKRNPPEWNTRPLHSLDVERRVAQLAAGSNLIREALLSARGVPNASQMIERLGDHANMLMTSGESGEATCEHGNKGWCPIRSCPNHRKG